MDLYNEKFMYDTCTLGQIVKNARVTCNFNLDPIGKQRRFLPLNCPVVSPEENDSTLR